MPAADEDLDAPPAWDGGEFDTAPAPGPVPEAAPPPPGWVRRGHKLWELFRGARRCDFCIVDERADHRVLVMTIGEQHDDAGRLIPITGSGGTDAGGFHYLTLVAAFRSVETAPGRTRVQYTILDRAACNSFKTAERNHPAMLDEWLDREPVAQTVRSQRRDAP